MFQLFEREEKKGFSPIPVERAILLSLAAHVVLLVLLFRAITADRRRPPPDPREGLLAALIPPPKDQIKIPLKFVEAPGPQRSNPNRSSPLSDADRRAGGGDARKPPAQSPFLAEKPGVSGLEAGARGRPSPPGAPAPNPKPQASRESGSETADPENGEQGLRAPPRGRSGSAQRQPVERLAGLDQAIQDAARGLPGGGEQGAGFPNPEGGFVDSGPFSFDSKWYDWGPYAREMIRRIKLHWDVPSLARLGWKGKVTVRYFILEDGTVDGAHIVSGSGVPPFDFAALQSIVRSNPFRALPRDLGSKREGVTVTFFYNIRPGSEDGEGE